MADNTAEKIYYDFIRKRITELRIQKNVSEYQMSYDLGKSKGYIQSISSGKALPSMEAFVDICLYFNMTPYEFFCAQNATQKLCGKLEDLEDSLSAEDIELVVNIAKRLADKN